MVSLGGISNALDRVPAGLRGDGVRKGTISLFDIF
jgi:hypothetical protein